MRVHTHAHKEKLFRKGKQFLRQKQAKFSNKLPPPPPEKNYSQERVEGDHHVSALASGDVAARK